MREKERSRVRAIVKENLRKLLAIKRMDRGLNARISKLCGVKKGIGERIDEGVLRWIGHMETMERDIKPLKGGSLSMGEPTT